MSPPCRNGGERAKERQGKKMTYEEFFAEVKEQFQKADVSHVTEHLAYQFNITGEAAGIFYVEEIGRAHV